MLGNDVQMVTKLRIQTNSSSYYRAG